MLNTNFSPWPCFTKEEANVASKIILSNKVNYWTGTEGKLFEKNFAKFSDASYAIALANGSLALELALRALDITGDDEVIVSPRSFIASVSCVIAVRATPIFSDVDANSGNITAKYIKAVISPKTKAIICVHLAGLPCEMDEIMVLANQHGIKVIEDCAQAHGAKYKGRSVGSIGHIAAWSFCQDKIITTAGEGGMVTTNDEGYYKKMWAYKDHGKSLDKINNPVKQAGFPYVHDGFGSNYRMTEIQAAIGNIQLTRMANWLEKRTKNAQMLQNVVKEFSALSAVIKPDYMVHAHYKFYCHVDERKLKEGWDKNKILTEINALGVPCYHGSCAEIYKESAFNNKSFKPKTPLVNAHSLSSKSLMFLVHPTLSELEVQKTVKAIVSVMNSAKAL